MGKMRDSQLFAVSTLSCESWRYHIVNQGQGQLPAMLLFHAINHFDKEKTIAFAGNEEKQRKTKLKTS